MAEFKNIAIRCPMELVQAIEALRSKRQAERPYEIVSVGSVIRELLARGLESVASESVTKRS